MELIDRVGLSDRIRHRATELSGGQQQRVAIARSMVNQPSLILLDEPTGAVDTETAEQLVDLLKRLNREDQVTIVIVTHDLDIAGQANRNIRLKDGKVLADERVETAGVSLKRRPGAGRLSCTRMRAAMIRRLLTFGAIGIGLTLAAVVGATAYQALRTPLQASSGTPLTPENCSPGPCVDVQGYTLWISDVKLDGTS